MSFYILLFCCQSLLRKGIKTSTKAVCANSVHTKASLHLTFSSVSLSLVPEDLKSESLHGSFHRSSTVLVLLTLSSGFCSVRNSMSYLRPGRGGENRRSVFYTGNSSAEEWELVDAPPKDFLEQKHHPDTHRRTDTLRYLIHPLARVSHVFLLHNTLMNRQNVSVFVVRVYHMCTLKLGVIKM